MSERDDAELLAQIARGDDPAAVRAAQAELYRRHVRYLYGALSKQRDKLLSLAGLSIEDVVQDTFARAFDRAASFKAAPELDPDRARRRTRAWLGRIAQNLIADGFRRFREVSASPYLEDAFADASVPAPDDDAPASRPDLEPIRAAMATLSDREQDILRVSALYFKAEGSQRLPNDVSAELCRRWKIKNDAVRAVRSRAMKKLRRALAGAEEAR